MSVTIGIGERNEKSLHAALKQYYARAGDEFEIKVDGYIIDIARPDQLIEIQTRNFAAIRRKLDALLEHHRVRLVYPIAQDKWIVRWSKSGKRMLGRRKSPKVGRVSDLFEELVSIPHLINHPNLIIDVVMIQVEEIRRVDGRGSWRRKGASIKDRKLLSVVETISFESKEDFLRLLPESLVQPFSNRRVAECVSCSIYAARRMTYCLKKMGAIQEVGKQGRQLLFERI